jgi:hypothetical protein
MTLAEIRERVDTISETWRGGEPEEQRIDLADLDAALAELDEVETETEAASEAVDQLRGRIEVLMDEIEISLGIEPEPIGLPNESEELETLELLPDEEDEAMVSVDDPKAGQLIGAVRGHLVSGSPIAALREDLDAIDALDDDATPALKSKLDELRAEVVKRIVEQDEAAQADEPVDVS